jgi:3D (Asp-Asp-Asp) domain-containing protein
MMRNIYKLAAGVLVFIVFSTSSPGDAKVSNKSPFKQTVLTDYYATGYFCVYNSELDGSQTVTRQISDINFTLKASFLFGGWGVPMQGTGRTSQDGDYIKYTGGGGGLVRITGPDAGKNMQGKRVISPGTLRDRYARLGITDFAGFGNLALMSPNNAAYVRTSSVTGTIGQTLEPWCSISVDPSLIPLGHTVTVSFKNDAPANDKPSQIICKTHDVGGAIKGKHIEIYLGEGQAAIESWIRSGGNRYVNVYLNDTSTD